MEVEALRLRTVPLICYLSGRPQAVGGARSIPADNQAGEHVGLRRELLVE